MNYILITPVKDEEVNLPKLAECIVNQTLLPKVWVIIDDCSRDDTPLIIKDLEDKFPWIHSLKFVGQTIRDLDIHFGKICNMAFEEALRQCHTMNFSTEYLAKVDADIIISKDCFEALLTKLEKKQKIGIASPYITDLKNAQFTFRELTAKKADKKKRDAWYDLLEPSDGVRIYRKATFEDIGGIPETMAPDNVALAKAKLKGWQLKRFGEVIAFKTRETSASINSIREGYRLQGLRRYYLDYHPLIVILFVVSEVLKGHPYRGIAIISGFIDGFSTKLEKIPDKDVRDYYRKTRFYEIARSIFNKII